MVDEVISNVVIHRNPAWSEAGNYLMRVDLAKYGSSGVEQLWVRRIEDTIVELCCIPFFTYGLGLGDIVATNEGHFFETIVEKRGHWSIRLAVEKRERTEQIHILLHDWLMSHQLLHEWHQPGYLAIDVNADFAEQEIVQFLEECESRSDFQYEIDK